MPSFMNRVSASLLVMFVAGCGDPPVCGDGLIGETELCDDGNNLDNDGCNTLCALPECGNSLVDASEGCDDGNVVGGDGCAADCAKLEVCGDADPRGMVAHDRTRLIG